LIGVDSAMMSSANLSHSTAISVDGTIFLLR